MVKLSTKFLFRKISKKNQLQPRKKDESDHDYLNRLTHLHLQSQFIDKIATISECQSVSVLYLQNNSLQTIHNMTNFPNLTHLYLQHNYINRMENLEPLKQLRKLYLGYNNISVVEGLEELKNLTELHVECQKLLEGETLYFDPRSLRQLSGSLKVLNVAYNNLTTVDCLAELVSLSDLNLEGNQLTDSEDLMETLTYLPMLQRLTTNENPLASDRKHLDNVIVASSSLKTLNGKNIDRQTRVFITNLTRNVESRRRLGQYSTHVFNSEQTLPGPRGDTPDVEPMPRLGSKLFPVLKRFGGSSSKFKRMPSASSANGFSPIFENCMKVSHTSDLGAYSRRTYSGSKK